MTNKLKEIIEKVDELKEQINHLRPISSVLEKRILQKFRIDWNYHSNNIEGNTLTFGETKTFLLHGLTAAGKPLKDHLDIRGHNEAILLLDDIIKEEKPITENFIRELHKLILVEPYFVDAITPEGQPSRKRIEIGKYKTLPNHVQTKTGETFYFASPEETPAKMSDLISWYNKVEQNIKTHPVKVASLLHYKFIRIHPFDDGNGRLARILMNLVLMKAGFPPVIIKTDLKSEYYKALQLADGGDENYFVIYIAEQLRASLDLFLKGAKGDNIFDDDEKLLKTLEYRIKKAVKFKENKEKEYNTSLEELLNFSFIPLIKKIFKDLKKYAKYSEKVNVYIFATDVKFELNDIIEKFKLEYKPQRNIKITFHFKHFSFKGITPFDVYLEFAIMIANKEKVYSIYNALGKEIIKKSIFEQLSSEELLDLSNGFKKDVYSKIEAIVEKFENRI